MKNHLSEMLDALTSAYSRTDYHNLQRDSPLETNIGKLFAIFAWGLDSVQERAELVRLWDDIDYAKGAVLDRYGANFGVRRNGASDSFYRLMIRVKLLSQLSGGDIDTVINAAASMFDIPAERVKLTELFPAKIKLEVDESDLTRETLRMVTDIFLMIKRILAAGVGLISALASEQPAIVYVGASTFLDIKSVLPGAQFDIEPKTKATVYVGGSNYGALQNVLNSDIIIEPKTKTEVFAATSIYGAVRTVLSTYVNVPLGRNAEINLGITKFSTVRQPLNAYIDVGSP